MGIMLVFDTLSIAGAFTWGLSPPDDLEGIPILYSMYKRFYIFECRNTSSSRIAMRTRRDDRYMPLPQSTCETQ